MWLYLERETALHRLHPVTKLTLLLLAFAGALAFSHPLWLLLPAALTAAVVGLFRLWRAYRTVALLMGILFVATTILWALFYGGGEALLRAGPLRISRHGLLYGVGMGIRLDLMVAAGIVFLATTRVEEFTWALRRLGVPFPIAFAMGLSFRLVPLFVDQARRVREAQRARGVEGASGGPLARVRSSLPLLAPVLLGSLRRADRLAVALEVRGFGARPARTSLREHRPSARDWIALLLVTALVTAAFVLRALGHGVLAGGRVPLL